MDMRGFLLFGHVLGLSLWVGVTLTLAMLSARARKTGEASCMAFTYRAGHEILKGPGVVGMLLTIVTGFGLAGVGGWGFFQVFPNHWLFQMQVLGTLAFLLALFIQIPNSGRLARAAEAAATAGEESTVFHRFRKRHAIVSSVNGALLLIIILLGTLRPGG